MILYYIAILFIVFCFGIAFGSLTVLIIRYSNEKRKIKKKHGFKGKSEIINMSGNAEYLGMHRHDQASENFK